jgi:hypothetical protein
MSAYIPPGNVFFEKGIGRCRNEYDSLSRENVIRTIRCPFVVPLYNLLASV